MNGHLMYRLFRTFCVWPYTQLFLIQWRNEKPSRQIWLLVQAQTVATVEAGLRMEAGNNSAIIIHGIPPQPKENEETNITIPQWVEDAWVGGEPTDTQSAVAI